MMEKMIFGRYVPADSIIHRMDPGQNYYYFLVRMYYVFLANNASHLCYLLVFILFYMFGLSRHSYYVFYMVDLNLLSGLVLFTFILQLFFTKEGTSYYLNSVRLRFMKKGLDKVSLFPLRFFFLILMTVIVNINNYTD